MAAESKAAATVPHVDVCVCTYRRPELLRRLLDGMTEQETEGQLTFSMIVVDNDGDGSGEVTVKEFKSQSALPVLYVRESRQSIALARNKAVECSTGDYIAFIDDDEFPTKRWLLTLYQACGQYKVDGVLGPVKPHFDQQPPRWVIDGKFYDRPSYPTGLVIDWRKGRTGNVLLKSHLLKSLDQPFNPEFRTGEDQDLFRRLIEQGHVFVWCHEAMAYEVVPSVRWTRGFMLKRAMLRGAIEPVQPEFGAGDIARSAAATLAYTLVLPVALVFGQGRFMSVLYKLSYHAGLLLATMGFDPIKHQYVTE